MHDFPHQYVVTASGTVGGEIDVTSGSLPVLHAAPPIEFDGPGDRWSPESLLVAAVSGCFILTFRQACVDLTRLRDARNAGPAGSGDAIHAVRHSRAPHGSRGDRRRPRASRARKGGARLPDHELPQRRPAPER